MKKKEKQFEETGKQIRETVSLTYAEAVRGEIANTRNTIEKNH